MLMEELTAWDRVGDIASTLPNQGSILVTWIVIGPSFDNILINLNVMNFRMMFKIVGH